MGCATRNKRYSNAYFTENQELVSQMESKWRRVCFIPDLKLFEKKFLSECYCKFSAYVLYYICLLWYIAAILTELI